MDPEEILLDERDNQFDDFPPISASLIAAINRRMPERWPNVEMPDRDIWVRCGQLRVIELLEFVKAKQERSAADKDE